jgi:hypothetical protein
METNQAGSKENFTSGKFNENTSTAIYGTPNSNNNNNLITFTSGATLTNSTESAVKDSNIPIINNHPIQKRMIHPFDDVPHQNPTTINTSATILVQPSTPSKPNKSRATISHTTPVNMDVSMEMPPSNIPTIEPFILGSNNSPRSPVRRKIPLTIGPLDMRQTNRIYQCYQRQLTRKNHLHHYHQLIQRM